MGLSASAHQPLLMSAFTAVLACWHNEQVVGLAVRRWQVWFPFRHYCASTLVRLCSHTCKRAV